MSKLGESTLPHAAWRGNDEKPELTFALRRRKNDVALRGLVVSSDDQVRGKLAEILGQCGVAAVLACTVTESAAALAADKVVVVLCQDYMTDGRYRDIVEMAAALGARVPVIVVSRTGDWPEYLTAIRDGAFDYVAYPLIPGELQRTIENALGEYGGYQRSERIQG
jgi:DNA-binding NtrC family response regulator